MIELTDRIFDKVANLADSVRAKLKKQGFVVPIKNHDGTLVFNHYQIVKNQYGLYDILERHETICKNINLLQSAILLANKLAANRILDAKIYELDQSYGHRLFDIDYYKRLIEKNNKKSSLQKISLLQIKYNNAVLRSHIIKQEITDLLNNLVQSAKYLK